MTEIARTARGAAGDGLLTFIGAAQAITTPGYQIDIEPVVFEESGRVLFEAENRMTAEQFDKFCRTTEWVGGSASVVVPFLDMWKAENIQPDDEEI